MSNVRLLLGTIILVIALVAQFYQKEVSRKPRLFDRLHRIYIAFNGILQLIIHITEKNTILFTYPPVGSFTSTGLVVSAKLPRFRDLYTLMIASAEPKSISAGQPVEFTESVTQFTKDGVLVEGLFWRKVRSLVDQYAVAPQKKKK